MPDSVRSGIWQQQQQQYQHQQQGQQHQSVWMEAGGGRGCWSGSGQAALVHTSPASQHRTAAAAAAASSAGQVVHPLEYGSVLPPPRLILIADQPVVKPLRHKASETAAAAPHHPGSGWIWPESSRNHELRRFFLSLLWSRLASAGGAGLGLFGGIPMGLPLTMGTAEVCCRPMS